MSKTAEAVYDAYEAAGFEKDAGVQRLLRVAGKSDDLTADWGGRAGSLHPRQRALDKVMRRVNAAGGLSAYAERAGDVTGNLTFREILQKAVRAGPK
jgi:hypothetical protein